MIRSFCSKETEALFADLDVPGFRAFERIARRKLLYLHRARSLQDLLVPPGYRLEALKGDRRGQYSIRINDRWRASVFSGEAAMLTTLRLLTIIKEDIWRARNSSNRFIQGRSFWKNS